MATRTRGHGEGSIRQRVLCGCGRTWTPSVTVLACPGCGVSARGRPVTWEARMAVGYRDGQRVRRSLYGSTRKEVADKLSAALAGLQRGQVPPPDRRTLSAFLVEWMAGLDTRVRPLTAERYREVLRRHVIPSLGATRLAALTPQRVEALLAEWKEAGLSARTVWHIRAVLRAALNDALRAGEVSRNAAALARAPRVTGYHVEPMSPAQAGAILDAVAGTDLGGPVSVALWTGLRQGELLGLRWSDVDLTGRRLTVNVTLQRCGGAWHVEPTKTERSRRTLSLPAPAAEALAAHRQRQLEQRLLVGPDWGAAHGDLVFTDALGRPLVRSTLSHAFRAALERAELPTVRFHDLRHAAATLMLASGTDLKVVSEVLGHSTIATTANVYAGVLDSLKVDAADRLARLVRPDG